eukprot:SAG11_NODE_10791_length_805_cov_1.283286_1_plen_93_part_01
MWERLEAMYKDMDTDENGSLDAQEVQTALVADESYADLMPSNALGWAEILEALDADNDGKISKKELFDAWEKTKPPHTLSWLEAQLQIQQQRI